MPVQSLPWSCSRNRLLDCLSHDQTGNTGENYPENYKSPPKASHTNDNWNNPKTKKCCPRIGSIMSFPPLIERHLCHYNGQKQDNHHFCVHFLVTLVFFVHSHMLKSQPFFGGHFLKGLQRILSENWITYLYVL